KESLLLRGQERQGAAAHEKPKKSCSNTNHLLFCSSNQYTNGKQGPLHEEPKAAKENLENGSKVLAAVKQDEVDEAKKYYLLLTKVWEEKVEKFQKEREELKEQITILQS
ncbi:unnamed protein product, partial [Amoebophrya sp. A25]